MDAQLPAGFPVLAELHAMHAPVHELSQQTPSTHAVDAH
jgi:hypothetical protein